MEKYLFAFNVAGLSPDHLEFLSTLPAFSKLMKTGKKAFLKPVFPCLTLPGQASISTGTYPADHGITANGFYNRDRFEISFWDQYRSLLLKEPVWEKIKKKRSDLKTAVLFWQNTLYGNADIIITPKPIHAEHELIQWCYSKPVGLYETIKKEIGDFNLMDYWGPFASAKSSRWITESAISVLKKYLPNMMMVYLPHLDYSCQKYGPKHKKVYDDLRIIDELIGKFVDELETLEIINESVVAVFSEYSLSEVNGAVLPNKLLKKAGLLHIREIENREYLDFEMSKAFAMVDHQIAHIYVKNNLEKEVIKILEAEDNIQYVFTKKQQKAYKVNHERSGELIAVTKPHKWFAYYWWDDPSKAPDFANKVDIHRKPGYDPLELFINHENMEIPADVSLIKGSHGSPPKDGKRMSAIMLSGAEVKKINLGKEIDMIDLALIFEQVLL